MPNTNKNKELIESIQKEHPLWLVQLEELFKALSMVSEDTYIYLTDLEHDYAIWSRNVVDTFDLPSTHMIGAGDIWEECIHPDDRESYHKSIDMIFSGQMDSHDMQYCAKDKTGRYDMCTCRGIVMKDEDGKPKYFGGSIKNHTLENRVDHLTGLMNKTGFFESLKGLIKHHQEAMIMMLGISEFSEVNSLFGYEFGNKVIHEVSKHFTAELANHGDYFRLDGVQSVLVSRHESSDVLKEKYEKLQKWLYEELEVEGHKIPLRLNGSLMHLDQFDIDDNTIFVCMTSAYRQSKRENNGNLVYFNDDKSERSHDRLRKINEIRLSQASDFEGFELYYQPVVSADKETLSGAEALIRWSNKEFGMVPPDQFMPILENDAIFYYLGLWILKQAMTDGLAMVKKYPDFTLHVNIAYTQIQNAGFPTDVLEIMKEVGYPAKNLCLELTERCRLIDQKLMKAFIAILKAEGVHFALDDFGTGYSSIGILKQFDLDVMKIDKSFIQKIEESEKTQKLIHNCVELAKIYEMETCVEGIETPTMRQAVLLSHVDNLQGYLYSKPIPVKDFYEKYKIGE